MPLESKLLLENGAEVNAKNKPGWTPLHSAAGKGHTELCKLLLDHGAEVSEDWEDRMVDDGNWW